MTYYCKRGRQVVRKQRSQGWEGYQGYGSQKRMKKPRNGVWLNLASVQGDVAVTNKRGCNSYSRAETVPIAHFYAGEVSP